jgi:hypothetical protein
MTRADEITLTLPSDRNYYEIAHLVLGGLAIRLDLTVDHLDDLQVALETVLNQQEADGELTVALRVDENELHTLVGPFPGTRLRAALERDDEGEQLSMRRLLGAVCDRFEVEDRAGGEWIALTKAYEATS